MTHNQETHCKQGPARVAPVIDRNRCEGKQACVAVCPYQVFTLDRVTPELRAGLSMRGKLKGMVHGWKQAFATNADACQGCGLCLAACPEQAITLVRTR